MRTSLPGRGLVTLLLLTLLSASAFQAKAQLVQINTGVANTPLYAVGPVYVSATLFYRYSRFAYLYTQSELAAVGILPGTQISTVGWMKSTANSAAGPAVLSIYMKNSSVTAYSDPTTTWASLSSGAILVYNEQAQSIPATDSPNYIDFTLSAPFMYSGGSLEILTEWDISAAPAPIATGAFEWVNTTVVDRIYASGGTSLPATLSSTMNNTDMDDRRPVIQFNVVLPTGIDENLETTVSIWPNPVEGFLNIRNGSGTAVERIVITNVLGEIVLEEPPSGAAANYQINVDNLVAGSYLVEVMTAAGRVVKRVTIR
jgi:Secretion system C-terminal sorting domain